MLIHLLIIIKNNLRANLLLMAGMFVIATSLWYAASKCSLYWNRNLYLYVCWAGNEHVLYQIACT